MATPAAKPKAKLDVDVTKPTPYTFDLGLLLANDPNPLTTSTPSAGSTPSTTSMTSSSALEAQLAATARDGAQALIAQFFRSCPLTSTPSGALFTLPPISTPLPREKPLPETKQPTTWEKFAARRGIKPKTREQRRAKGTQYNEATGAWERTWGYDKGGAAKRREEGHVQQDWLVEVDDKGDKTAGEVREKNRSGGRSGVKKSVGTSGKKRRTA
ncbi:Uu.00g040890.m01.CDS01 [Anthostomella pinea]|uniref:Ribosome biogenesis regulatory protein n=1 Tax=Anthostomella pinea TaxID=933095 RepID=A0AAI8VBB6_9PEZI|nr:Uu.00g040890.m01.CDS01 [Anthostomella pinea]